MKVKDLLVALQAADPELPVMVNELGSVFAFDLLHVQIGSDPNEEQHYGVTLVGGLRDPQPLLSRKSV